ncbi:hypothetical protein NRB_26620 [Novosphingobium sp. 11B]
MTHQPCKCIEEINAALDEHTLDTAIVFSRDLRGMTARTYTGLMRKDNGKAETRSHKPRVFGHKFCPFCGSAYDPAPATSADLVKLLDDPNVAAAVNEQGGGRHA